MKTGLRGTLIASAVAAMFVANACRAADTSSSGAPSSGGTQSAKVKCVGGNDCKGKGSCSGGGHDCMGHNSCKGKGWVATATDKECTTKGGKPEPLTSM